MIKLKQGQIKKYREDMLAKQGGRCAFCYSDCRKPCLDHAHRDPYKDKIRGVLCNWCNIAIGKLENARIRTGTSWEEFDAAFQEVHDYIHTPRELADWHPSKRKSEVTEFRKLNAHDQVMELLQIGPIVGFDIDGWFAVAVRNSTQRISLFKKLNQKTWKKKTN